ncbi:MAG TPA: hypothetical protein VK212_02890 [Lentimicrobium sp.]|nr:hypothetical protein [Lentimicrobium sp.]
MKKLHYLLLLCCIAGASFLSCVKDDEIDNDTGIELSFSEDTLLFDTVFTTVGSATQTFKVYNPSEKKIVISSIRLGKGESSPYRFNVDGISSTEVTNLEIRGKDSAFVFVKVTIDPNNENAPFIQQDSLIFVTNSNTQDVKLVAWGQDAHFYYRGLISSDYVFEADKPHVIYDILFVDSLSTLEVNAGARIYLHPGAIIVINSTASLKIRGTADAPVIIEGDRMEDAFKDMTGQWDRIWLYPGSINNEIDYAIIRNGDVGLQVDTVGNSSNPTLRISNSMIYNMKETGLLAQGTTIDAANCVFANSGSFALALTLGGSYDFRHCTIANYWQNFQEYSGLMLNNYYIDVNQNIQVRDLEKAYFGNCVVYGYQDDELYLDKAPSGGTFNYTFDHCLLKTTLDISDPAHYLNTLKNNEPWFRDPELYEFEPDSTLSSVINAGSIEVVNSSFFDITKDIRQKSRIDDAAPDIGAYEFMEDLRKPGNR